MKPLEQKHNSHLFLRPRFQVDLPVSFNTVLKVFSEELGKNKTNFPHTILDSHIFIDIPKKENHFWSPQLHLEIVELDKGSRLKGLMGPKPQVWTLFMFVHFVIGTAFLACCAWGYSNYSLGKEMALPIVFLVILPVVWVILYFIGRLGRDVGKKQIQKLQVFTLNTINRL